MTNPTERPEERDSLAQELRVDQAAVARVQQQWNESRLAGIENRLAKGYDLGAPDVADEWNAAYDDLRTLINEVKERDERIAALAEALRRFESSEERANDLLEVLNDQASRIVALEAEVKELREENARLQKRLLGTSR